MKLSRIKTRASLLLLLTGTAVAVVGALLSIETCSILGLVLLLAGLLLFFVTNRCPYCDDTFRGLSWSKPDAGYCRNCGKKMEYDN